MECETDKTQNYPLNEKSSDSSSDSSSDDSNYTNIAGRNITALLLDFGVPCNDSWESSYESSDDDSNENPFIDIHKSEPKTKTKPKTKLSCEKCNDPFNDIRLKYIKLKKANKAWTYCSPTVKFKSKNQNICIFCITNEKGIECDKCKIKYYYRSSFYEEGECKNCYIKSRRGCIQCFDYVDQNSETKICQECQAKFNSLKIFTKQLVVNREIMISKRNNKSITKLHKE